MTCYRRDIIVEGDVVPGDILFDVVRGNALFVKLYLHGAGRVRDAGQQVIQIMFFQRLNGLVAQSVIAERTDGDGVVHTQELSGMIGEVGRCTPQFLTFWKHIPKDFSESHYITFLFHGFMRFSVV